MTDAVNRRATLALGALAMTLPHLPAHTATGPADEETADVVVSGVEIQARITHPAQPPRAALLLLPGSLYSDVDGNYPSMNLWPHAYADLARQLAQRGLVVLRMAKIGPGTGSRTLDAARAERHLDFTTRVDVAAAGLARLRRSAPAGRCVVAGHSEGALVASLLAQAPEGRDVDGVVSLSGPAQPLLTLLRDQVLRMAPPGTTPDLRMLDAVLAALRAGQPLPEAARHDPQAAMLAGMPAQAHAYLRSVDRVDPVAALARVPQPVLIVQGEQDESVPAQHAQLLAQARAERPTRMQRFAGLTHFYKRAEPGLPAFAAMALTTESDAAVADAIVSWIGELAVAAR